MKAIMGAPYSLKRTRQDVTCTLLVQNDATGGTVLTRRVVDAYGTAIVVCNGDERDAFGIKQYTRMLKTARAGALIAGRKLATLWNDMAAHERYWDDQARLKKHCEEQYAQAKARKQARG